MKVLHFWFKNARLTALPQSILPAILAAIMAFNYSDFSFFYAVLSIFGVIFAHLSINLFDDYFDYKNQNVKIRAELAENKLFSRIGKCDYLINKQATTKQLFIAATAFLFVAIVLGGIIFLYRGKFILFLGLIGGFLGLFYSAKPICLSYRGLGEIVVGIMFGLLLMIGVFYSSCGIYNSTIVIISAAVGLLVTNILFVHSILDYLPDKHTGKKTLATLIRSNKGRFIVLCFTNLSPFLLIGYGVYTSVLTLWYLLTFLSLPLACCLIYMFVVFFRNPQKKFTPKFWYGFMENWDKISQNGVDWFMIRWYLARNLTVFFCLLAIIASLLSQFNVFYL